MIWVFFLSLIPGVEGRYAAFYGLLRGEGVFRSFLGGFIGTLLLSWLLAFVVPLLIPSDTSQPHILSTYLRATRAKVKPYLKRWGFIGLVLFVALPLPGSGVWSGGIAAQLLGMPRWTTFLGLLLGGIISMFITLLPSLGVLWVR